MAVTKTNLNHEVRSIQSKDDLARFIRTLRDDLSSDPASWENDSLERYLEALAAVIEDMNGYYLNRGEQPPKQPDWKTLGELLISAKYYE